MHFHHTFPKLCIVGNIFFVKAAVLFPFGFSKQRDAIVSLFCVQFLVLSISLALSIICLCQAIVSCILLFERCMFVVYWHISKKSRTHVSFASVFAIIAYHCQTFYNSCSLLAEVSETSFSLQLQSFCENLTNQFQHKNFENCKVYLLKSSLWGKDFFKVTTDLRVENSMSKHSD